MTREGPAMGCDPYIVGWQGRQAGWSGNLELSCCVKHMGCFIPLSFSSDADELTNKLGTWDIAGPLVKRKNTWSLRLTYLHPESGITQRSLSGPPGPACFACRLQAHNSRPKSNSQAPGSGAGAMSHISLVWLGSASCLKLQLAKVFCTWGTEQSLEVWSSEHTLARFSPTNA